MLPSIFIVGLVKSGSTLLNRIMRPITAAAGLTYRSPADEMFKRGLNFKKSTVDFEPFGYAYGGFRDLPWPLPDYAGGRTVVLVRDPRDALTSFYFSMAYSHVPPGTADSPDLLRAFEVRRDRARHDDRRLRPAGGAGARAPDQADIEERAAGTIVSL